MRKSLLVLMIAALLLLCACKPDGSQSTGNTEGGVPNTTDLILDPDKDWEGDIDLVDDTTEDSVDDDTTGSTENNTDTTEDEGPVNSDGSSGGTEKPNEGGNVSGGKDNPGNDDKPDVPQDTTEGEPFDPDFPIDVVDPAVTTEPNQDQSGENTDEPNEGGSSGGNTDEPNEGGSSGGNTDEPAEGGNSDEPDEGGNSSGGGIELPIIPG